MSLLMILLCVNSCDLGDITDADVAISVVHASVNLALNKPVWAENSNIDPPGSMAVDGDVETWAYIYTILDWPFLAVDLGGPVTVDRILLRVDRRECQVW